MKKNVKVALLVGVELSIFVTIIGVNASAIVAHMPQVLAGDHQAVTAIMSVLNTTINGFMAALLVLAPLYAYKYFRGRMREPDPVMHFATGTTFLQMGSCLACACGAAILWIAGSSPPFGAVLMLGLIGGWGIVIVLLGVGHLRRVLRESR